MCRIAVVATTAGCNRKTKSMHTYCFFNCCVLVGPGVCVCVCVDLLPIRFSLKCNIRFRCTKRACVNMLYICVCMRERSSILRYCSMLDWAHTHTVWHSVRWLLDAAIQFFIHNARLTSVYRFLFSVFFFPLSLVRSISLSRLILTLYCRRPLSTMSPSLLAQYVYYYYYFLSRHSSIRFRRYLSRSVSQFFRCRNSSVFFCVQIVFSFASTDRPQSDEWDK